MKWRFLWATVASATLGCSAKPASDGDAGVNAAACPMVFPSACPAASAPTWSGDVQPIVERRCYPCHGPGGVEQAAQDFTSYQGFSVAKATVDDQVYHCLMPPPDAGAATPAEQLTILTWIVCGGLDD